jgi:hypothetical protein
LTIDDVGAQDITTAGIAFAVADVPTMPKSPTSTALTIEEEAVIVAF